MLGCSKGCAAGYLFELLGSAFSVERVQLLQNK